jgi:Zinc knuckle
MRATGFGRQSRRGGGRGGRGHGARGNHSSNRNSQPSVNRSTILNFPIGSSPNPGDVQRWMVMFSTTAALECPKSGVAKIINDDGTIGSYPRRDEPEFPDESDDDYEALKVRYSSSIKRYDDWTEDLIEEKRKLVALIKSKLGADSLSRVRATERGRRAINEDDPKGLLEEIYATHNTDLLLDKAQNVVVAEKRFNAVQQGEQEELITYFERFKALRQALKNALTNNGEDPKKRMPTEANQAVLFIIGLNAMYRTFKRSFVDGTNTDGYPDTLETAYERAQRASTDMITYRRYNDYRGVFAADRGGRGHRGGRGRGRQHERRNDDDDGRGGGRGPKPRTCYICRQPGHYAAQCPDRDDAVITQALQNNSEQENA